MAWTEDQKNAVIEAYEAEEPTPATTEEILQLLSDESQEDEEPRTVNAIRRILNNAGVYVKKEPTVSETKPKAKKLTAKAIALAKFQKVLDLNDVEFSLDEEDTKKMTAKVLEAVVDLVGQVGQALPED